MGHIRIGTLPKTRRWREVVELLEESPQLTGALTAALIEAAEVRLRSLATDESLNYAFWLLTRIASAAQEGNFVAQLSRLGLELNEGTSTLSLISDITDKVRQRSAGNVESGDFGGLASLALRRALMDTVAEHGPSLFGSSVEDVHAALRSYSTPVRFGVVSQRFFADFFARTLRSLLDRDLANRIGDSHAIRNLAEGQEFSQALDLYTRQAARITQGFAEGWYSKHNWQSRREITPRNPVDLSDTRSRNYGWNSRRVRVHREPSALPLRPSDGSQFAVATSLGSSRRHQPPRWQLEPPHRELVARPPWERRQSHVRPPPRRSVRLCGGPERKSGRCD